MEDYKIIAKSDDGKTLVVQYNKTGKIEIRTLNLKRGEMNVQEFTPDNVVFSMEKYF